MRTRRQHAPAFKRKAVRYLLKYGPKAASAKFDVVPSVINRWARTSPKTGRSERPKPNHLDTIVLLKKAHRHDLAAIRSGGDFTFAGVYNWLALTSLTGESE